MTPHRPGFLIACLLVLLSVLAAGPASAVEVILLHDTGAPTLWTKRLDRDLRDALDKGDNLQQGFLGSPHLGDEYFESRFQALSERWRGLFPAAVIADGATAFAFVRKYGEALFPTAPVVLVDDTRPAPALMAQCGRCTALTTPSDVRGTIDLIFRLRPETDTVVGIMDGSPRSRTLRRAAETAMTPYLDRATILFPGHEPGDDDGLAPDELQAVASSVPVRGAVLFLGYGEDATGRPLDQDRAVRLLTEGSAAPVYGLADTWMATDGSGGMLGGSMVRSRDLARRTVRVVERLRAGEPAEEMLPEPVAPVVMADLTVLARLGIDPARLPAGAVTINSPDAPPDAEPVDTTGWGLVLSGLLAVFGVLWLLRRPGGRRGRPPRQRP